MNHKKYIGWIQLFLYDELTQNEKDELLNHLNDCNECNAEYEKQKRFFSVMKSSSFPEANQNLLSEARREFNAALRVEKSKRSVSFAKMNILDFFASPLKASFGGAVVLAAGILIGFLLFNKPDENIIPFIQEKNSLSSLEERTQISNLRFVDQDPSDGEIEFIVDAIKPIHIKGKVNDPKIQNLLTYSMLYENNPGVRLNAINLISNNVAQNDDKEIKAALMTVAKFDTNLGVRREALKLLRNFSYDSEVREALLYILLNDENSAMRIEAISSLKEISEKGNGFNQDEISAFKENLEKEENNYVKFQIKTVLQENRENEK